MKETLFPSVRVRNPLKHPFRKLMDAEQSHCPYLVVGRTKVNLSARHDDYFMFSFAGKHPVVGIPFT